MFADEERMQKRINEIDAELKKICRMESGFPPGEFYCTKNGNMYKWHIRKDGKTQYLSKKEMELAQNLALKKYYQCKKETLLQERSACQKYLYLLSKVDDKSEQILNHLEYVRLIGGRLHSVSKELAMWMEEDYEVNERHPEGLNIRATQGRIVRSKSEAIIDKALYTNGIPFRYEQKLVLGNVAIYPDFTIRHPQNGRIFYWEHMGMMDNPEYVNHACQKIKLYCRHGIIPSDNLILTYETREKPLEIQRIERIVKEYFV